MSYLVQHLLQEGLVANSQGTAVAQVDGTTVSFTDLDRMSNRFARLLASLGVTRQDRVLFCLEKSIDYLTAMIGALKADAIYVPVYEKSPQVRLRQIIRDCSPVACVVDSTTSSAVIEACKDIPNRPRIVSLGRQSSGSVEAIWSDLDSQLDSEVASSNTDQDIAYLMYTSGSTGLPKGVMVTHANVMDYAAWGTSYFSMSATDRVLNTAPFYFDMSIFDIFCSLKSGATLCLATENEYLFPGRLIDVIDGYSITIWKAVSSLLGYLSKTNAIKTGRLGTLQKLIFAGERLQTRYLAHWMRTYPEIRFFNGYGPTEATGISICHAFTGSVAPASSVPLGYPCRNTEIHVLRDASLDVCETGETGEICIRGAGVSAGYWNDSERTRQKFISVCGPGQSLVRLYRTGDAGYVDDSGLVWFAGRLDDQVKVQGFRIELGDVGNAIAELEGVNEASVLLLPDQNGNDSLVAFIECSKSAAPGGFRDRLLASLPAYMVPRTQHCFASLPRTERGKIDKNALRAWHAASLSRTGNTS